MSKMCIILLGIVSLLSIDVLVHVYLNEYAKHLFLKDNLNRQLNVLPSVFHMGLTCS